jgi:Protein of unknown function (DUF4089)
MTEKQIAAYVDAACAANGIVLAADERDRVIDHFTRIAAIAAPLLEMTLPPEADMAPVFRP